MEHEFILKTISENNGEYYIEYIKRTAPVSSLSLSENEYSNDNATKVLTSIFSSKKFDYSKPVSLIKFICKLVANKNALILDFFAGSGTTAQAVLELNQQDGGQRKFILIICLSAKGTNGVMKKELSL